MMKEETTATVYAGEDLKEVLWELLLDEIYTGEELTRWKENLAPKKFNHWAYLKALEDRGVKVLINQFDSSVKVAIN